jgi:Holliday junction resolvase RusA-like endonuclease
LSPKKQQGTMSAVESNEVLAGLSALVVQPAGNLYLFEIPPYSAQNNSPSKTIDSLSLKNEITTKLASISKAHDAPNGSISMKVVFMIGKGESEKDVDNMLKWFLDIFKEATGADDAAISDLRVIKKRLNHRKGMIGLSVKTSSINTFGDIETAAMQTIINQKGKTPSDLERCLKAVELLQNQMNELLRPKFTK